MTCSRIASLVLLLAVLAGKAPCQDDTFLVGEYLVTRVVDGDTIGVEGLDSTIRFLCIDTEECEKGPGALERTRALAADFYRTSRERVMADPLGQFTTPMGWEARTFAEAWFPIGSRVRVEYDSLKRKTGYFSRVLGYVFVQRDGRWVNYNIECVRAGMSPYFNKYGKSLRFECDFLAAEREARTHRRGIWSPYAMSYPNYDDRLIAWSRRADCIARFDVVWGAHPEAVNLLDDDDWERLESLVGKHVVLFATVRDLVDDPEEPALELHHNQNARVLVAFADWEVFEPVRDLVMRHEEDFFHVTGVLEPEPTAPAGPSPYRLIVAETSQVYLELPAADWRRIEPRRALRFSGTRIDWKDGLAHLGEEVGVVGTIVRTAVVGERTFLNFDPDYRSTLSIVIEERSYGAFPAVPAELYADRLVLVRGRVTEHKGAAQIVVTSADQIEIVE